MKRNRFAEMVPPTPEDFHISVLDALNRMETVRVRRAQRMRSVRYAAAGVAVVAALTVLLTAFVNRPTPRDTVVSPGDAVETILPTQECAFTLGDWQLDEAGVSMDWTIAGNNGELLLYTYDIQFMTADGLWNGWDFFERPEYPGRGYFGLLGTEVLGHELPVVVQQAERCEWSRASQGRMPQEGLTAVITFDFYRPKAEFFEDYTMKFENEPHLMIHAWGDGLEAWPINWSGNTDYQTPYGESSLEVLTDYENYLAENEPGSVEEVVQNMRGYSELQRVAMDMYGYAEFVKGYTMTIDLSAGSGTGATWMEVK